MVKTRRSKPVFLPGAATLLSVLLILLSCAAPRQFTKEEAEARSRPGHDPRLARLVEIALEHGYDLRDSDAPRTRYLTLERSAGTTIDRRYFEVELGEDGPISVFFLINTGSKEATRLGDYPARSREQAERFLEEEEARGGTATPVMIEKTFMVKEAFLRNCGGLMFSRSVIHLELTDIFGASHENGQLYRYFGQREKPVAAVEMEAADRLFDTEVQRFLGAYDKGGS